MSENRSSIVWIQAITCNGNSHSFLNYPYLKSFFKDFYFVFHPHYHNRDKFLEVINGNNEYDYLIIEGAFTKNINQLTRYGIGFEEIFKKLENRVKKIICAGSCASFGGIFRQYNPKEISGLLFANEVESDFLSKIQIEKLKDKIINVSGCPVHPQWLVDTLYLSKNKKNFFLDEYHRPKDIFAYLTHHGCIRNEYFEWKVDCNSYGEKEGCMFYEQGCRGPMTHASCNKTLWNEVSSKTRSGSPCLGCTEFNYPQESLFETKKMMSLPATPFGVPKRAYYTLAGVAKSFKIERLNKKLIDE